MAFEGLIDIFKAWRKNKPEGVLTSEFQIPISERIKVLEYSAEKFWRKREAKLLLAPLYYETGDMGKSERALEPTFELDYCNWLACRNGPGPEFEYLAKTGPDSPVLGAVRLFQGEEKILGAAVSQSKESGPQVERIIGCGLAVEAGLELNDHIGKVNGKETPTLVTLARALAGIQPGSRVSVEVRKGADTAPVTVTAMLDEQSPNPPLGWLGIVLRHDVHRIVDVVLQGEPADKAGLKKGDRINRVNGQQVGDASFLRCLLRPGAPVTLEVTRDEQKRTMTARPSKRPSKATIDSIYSKYPGHYFESIQ